MVMLIKINMAREQEDARHNLAGQEWSSQSGDRQRRKAQERLAPDLRLSLSRE
jgi:hypothetical protein